MWSSMNTATSRNRRLSKERHKCPLCSSDGADNMLTGDDSHQLYTSMVLHSNSILLHPSDHIEHAAVIEPTGVGARRVCFRDSM